MIVPFRLCFNEEAAGGFKVFETIIDIIFLIDILFSFNTGFYKKGYLVMKRKEIVINYLKTWFLIDLVASFPYAWFFNMAGEDIDAPDVSTDYTIYDPTTNSTLGYDNSYNGNGGNHLYSRTP